MNHPAKTAGERLTAAQKKARTLELRQQGETLATIAGELGCGVTRVHQYIAGELQKLNQQSGEDARLMRTLEAERLDRLQVALWEKAEAGELRAVDRILKIMERRAKLFGLDGPTKVAATDPDGQEPRARVVLVPAPAGSVEEWVITGTNQPKVLQGHFYRPRIGRGKPWFIQVWSWPHHVMQRHHRAALPR